MIKERWILFYDGGCPLCRHLKKNLGISDSFIKLTTVSLSSELANVFGYKQLTLVVMYANKEIIYEGYDAFLVILEKSKYSWLANIFSGKLSWYIYLVLSKIRKILKYKKQ